MEVGNDNYALAKDHRRHHHDFQKDVDAGHCSPETMATTTGLDSASSRTRSPQ